MGKNSYISSFKNAAPYIFIGAFAFFMFRGIFAPGFMSGYDNSFHYYDTYYLANTLIPEYHWISGWSMQGMAGMPIFVDYNQITPLVMVILNKIFFLPLDFVYKLMVLFSYMFLGAGFYKFASSRFGKVAALFIATCLMLQADIYRDMLLAGMWNNALAIGLLFIFLHYLDGYIKNMATKRAFLLGLILALIILIHLYTAVVAFLILCIYLFPYIVTAYRNKVNFRKSLIYSCIITLSAIMISSYYLYGFIIARNYFEKLGGSLALTYGLWWGLKSFLGPLEPVNNIPAFMINLPVLIRIFFGFLGFYIFFRKEKNLNSKRSLWHIFCFVMVCFLLSIDIFANCWQRLPLIKTLQMSRFFIYIQLGMYIFAAYGFGKFMQFFKGKRAVIAACVFPVTISLFFHYAYIARNATKTLEQSPQMQNVYRVWDWVNANIPVDRSRIAYQNTVKNKNVKDTILSRSDVFALSGIFTKVPQIGVSRPASSFPQEKFVRNDQGNIFGMLIKDTDDIRIGDRMRYFNAGHIVSAEPNLKQKLAESELFSKEANFGIFSIFRLKNFRSKWIDFEKGATYANLCLDNQHIEVDIQNGFAENHVFIKVARHPLWKARLNGIRVPISWDKYNLMKVSLPEKGFYKLVLSFNSFNVFWTAVSLLGVIICMTGITQKREDR